MDKRGGSRRRRAFALTPEETALYLRIDSAVRRTSLRGDGPVVDRWIDEGLALVIDGRVLSLATYPDRPHGSAAAELPLHAPPPSGFVSLDEIATIM